MVQAVTPHKQIQRHYMGLIISLIKVVCAANLQPSSEQGYDIQHIVVCDELLWSSLYLAGRSSG